MILASYEEIDLRKFEESDIPQKVEWINNPLNNQYLHYDIPLKVDKTIQWFRNKDNSKRVDCIIEYKGIPVGLIGLLQIDNINSKAEYYITIGETQYKHRGIATKATKAILDYAFSSLKLHKVYLTVDARNELAIRLYERVGFEREGYFVDDLYHPKNEEYIDRIRYATLQNTGGGVKLYFQIFNWNENTTIIQKLEHKNSNNDFYIKRDDMIPVSFGGNKARKALYFFREICKGNYDCIVTYGSSSSNHCRIIANIAASKSIPCYIISPEEAYTPTFNSKMMDIFGADITVVPVENVHETIENKLIELKNAGKKPYFIAGGGHGNLGTQSYVDCYEEIRQYEKRKGIHFDYIFFASGTGTTQAGLVCGSLMYGDEREIIGISIARKNPRGRQVVIDSIYEYLSEIRCCLEDSRIQDAVIFNDDYTGDGYARKNEAIAETIKEVLIKYGIPLDTTYTGKAFYGMEDYLDQNQIKNKKILFIHTGGTPLFFDFLKNTGK